MFEFFEQIIVTRNAAGTSCYLHTFFYIVGKNILVSRLLLLAQITSFFLSNFEFSYLQMTHPLLPEHIFQQLCINNVFSLKGRFLQSER